MSDKNDENLTVQGVMSSVPAISMSEQAGSQSSLSSDRNVSDVGNLATDADTSTSTTSNDDKNFSFSLRHNKPANSPIAKLFRAHQVRKTPTTSGK